MKKTTAQAIKNSGVIPVFYFHDIDSNISVVNACFKGGVEPSKENLKAWFDAGVVCVGMGSKLIEKEMIAKPELLTNKVIELIEIIRSVRNKNE